MKTLARKRSSANSLSLNPSNCINHRNTGDFSSSKNLDTIVPGTLPASIAAKSLGKFFNNLLAFASTIRASSMFLSSTNDPSSPPLPPPPLPLPLFPLLLLLSLPGNDMASFAMEKAVSRWR